VCVCVCVVCLPNHTTTTTTVHVVSNIIIINLRVSIYVSPYTHTVVFQHAAAAAFPASSPKAVLRSCDLGNFFTES